MKTRFEEEIKDVEDLIQNINSKINFEDSRESQKFDHISTVLGQVKKSLINFDLRRPTVKEMEDFWNDK